MQVMILVVLALACFSVAFGVKHLAGIGVDQDRTFGSDIQVRAGMLQYAPSRWK